MSTPRKKTLIFYGINGEEKGASQPHHKGLYSIKSTKVDMPLETEMVEFKREHTEIESKNKQNKFDTIRGLLDLPLPMGGYEYPGSIVCQWLVTKMGLKIDKGELKTETDCLKWASDRYLEFFNYLRIEANNQLTGEKKPLPLVQEADIHILVHLNKRLLSNDPALAGGSEYISPDHKEELDYKELKHSLAFKLAEKKKGKFGQQIEDPVTKLDSLIKTVEKILSENEVKNNPSEAILKKFHTTFKKLTDKIIKYQPEFKSADPLYFEFVKNKRKEFADRYASWQTQISQARGSLLTDEPLEEREMRGHELQMLRELAGMGDEEFDLGISDPGIKVSEIGLFGPSSPSVINKSPEKDKAADEDKNKIPTPKAPKGGKDK